MSKPEVEPSIRSAQGEAEELAGDQWATRVLEPSPPAIDDGDWFADDPVELPASDKDLLMPAGMAPADGTAIDWTSWLAANPEHQDWVASRWLGGPRHLPDVPESLVSTRTALHRLAAYVIAPTRHQANSKFGLRWTLGGFGTPFFGDDRQVRAVGNNLVDQRANEVHSEPISTLSAAAEFLETTISSEAGAEHDSPAVGDIDERLDVDPASAAFLGDWFGMATAALERLRNDEGSVDPSRPQLWPGHFDAAIEVGDEDHRASYGASPGDPSIAEPYLYVSVWWPDRAGVDGDDPIWNAPSFTGAILPLSQFGDVTGQAATDDPVEVATRFWLDVRDKLT